MPRLSVIVPVYNVEAYLPACIDSILNQSLQNIELILIDDGSPDRCGKICDEYAEKDERIKVIHQSNHGVSNARNAGLKIVSGENIGFVDADDIIDCGMYDALIKGKDEIGADIAICGFAYCSEDGIETRKEPLQASVFSQRELLLSIYGMPNKLHGSLCNKVFSRQILEGLAFDESVSIGEDWLLLYECYERTNKAVVLEDCLYTIRTRSDSATRKLTAKLYMNKLETYYRLFRYADGKDKKIRKQATAKILDACLTNKAAIIRDDYDRKSLIRINKKMIRISISSFLRGRLSFKRMIYHVSKGLQL